MSATARVNLRLSAVDEDLVARGAALTGTTVAAFVRTAAKQKAHQLIGRETQIVMSARDFEALTQAIDRPWQPNAPMRRALQSADAVKR